MQLKILILIELTAQSIHPISFELIGKSREVAGEHAIIDALVLGPVGLNLSPLNRHGCDTVYYFSDDIFINPEELLYQSNITPFLKEQNPDIILIGATTFGRSLAPRLAASLETGLTADCTELKLDGGKLIQIRPAFSGNILAHIETITRPQMATIRYKEFKASGTEAPRPICVKNLVPPVLKVSGVNVIRALPEEDVKISDAEVIVAAGRGVRRKEDLNLLRTLADLLHGKLGVSRALVDSGMVDSTSQIGYSGHRVKPKLYIACGISGAPQHLSGMKESGTIVAINQDPTAPIFSVCDIGITGDLYDIVPRLIADLKAQTKEMPNAQTLGIGGVFS